MNTKLIAMILTISCTSYINGMFSQSARKFATNIAKESSLAKSLGKKALAGTAFATTIYTGKQLIDNNYNVENTAEAIKKDGIKAKYFVTETASKISDWISKNGGNDTPPTI